MGLRGLTHYINHRCPGIFRQKVPLHNTRVIVDGNNFLHTFIRTSIQHYDCFLGFGCNYDTYHRALKDFIEKMRLCKLELVFIFVGTTSCQEYIFEKVKGRNQQRVDKLEQFITDNYSIIHRDLPRALLVKQTLIRCLDDYCVHHLTMDFEEDEQIVALANRWRCPIITADSDFYLYQYRNGAFVIPWSRFPWRSMKVHGRPPENYLETTAYYTEDFADFHGISTEFVALFGAVQLQMDENENLKDELPADLQIEERDDHLKSLLQRLLHLAEQNSLEDLLSHADEFFFHIDDDELREAIEKRVKEFMDKEAKIEYYSYLEEGKTVDSSEIRARSNKSLPEWFIRGFRSSQINRYFAGVLALHETNLYTQLEDLESPSPNECSSPIRAVLWGILLKYDCGEEVHDASVTEHYREGKYVIVRALTPCVNFNFTSVPSLDEIPDMSLPQRIDFICQVVNTDQSILEGFPDKFWFFILVTRFWIKACKPQQSYIQAMILSYIKLGFVGDLSFNEIVLEESKVKAKPVEVARACRNLQPSKLKIPVIKNSPDRIKVHHKFTEWITIYSEVYRLNEIMLKPVVELGPEQCFRGTFLYSLQRYLQPAEGIIGPAEPEQFIRGVLGPVYEGMYQPLWTVLNK